MRINLLRLRKDVQMTVFVVQLIHDACIYNRSYRLASITFQATLRKSRSVVFITSRLIPISRRIILYRSLKMPGFTPPVSRGHEVKNTWKRDYGPANVIFLQKQIFDFFDPR